MTTNRTHWFFQRPRGVLMRPACYIVRVVLGYIERVVKLVNTYASEAYGATLGSSNLPVLTSFMNNWSNLFKGKSITLMGLGLLGRGVGDAVFLAKAGAKLTITDLKNEKELASSLRALRVLKKFKDIKFVLGGHNLEDFRNADM